MELNVGKIFELSRTNIDFVTTYELNKIFRSDDIIIITNETILSMFPDMFDDVLEKCIILPGGVENKTLEFFSLICCELTKRKVSKNTWLFGVGGGSITDLTGFVASVFLRGIKVNFVPTTLMAMVDASIGGKNAININTIKNAIGSVYLPQNVFINTLFLRSLTHQDFLAGFAEIIKTGLIFDFQLVNESLYYMDGITTLLNSILINCINHKMKIVAEDLFDSGNRHFLNFGHTIANLLELEYELSHGFAVAYGILFETKIAVELKLTDISIYNEIYRIITKYFEHCLEDFELKNISEKIFFDKKVTNNKIRIPVIKEIGRAVLMDVNVKDFINCAKTIKL